MSPATVEVGVTSWLERCTSRPLARPLQTMRFGCHSSDSDSNSTHFTGDTGVPHVASEARPIEDPIPEPTDVAIAYSLSRRRRNIGNDFDVLADGDAHG